MSPRSAARAAASSIAFAILAAARAFAALPQTDRAAAADARIAPEHLAADLALLERALSALHPGATRYLTPEELARELAALRARLAQGANRREAYLEISRLLARIRCGHTYANFHNQPEDVAAELFGGQDKLPFTFRIVDRRMLVEHDASLERKLARGAEIVAIDARPVAAILADLIGLVKADGSNDAKRIFDLQLTGAGRFEPFDVYFPLLHPPREQRFQLEIVDPSTGELTRVDVEAITRERRALVLRERGAMLPTTEDDLWRFELLEERVARLSIGSFVTWNLRIDWRAFLERSFATLRERGVEDLILDVRGNEGGDDEVVLALLGHLAHREIELEPRRVRVRYVKVPEDLAPHVSTWDRSFLDRSGAVRDAGEGYFALEGRDETSSSIAPSPDAFAGRVHLLVDAANSSATFHLARVLKASGRATLIGSPTGGNQRGGNGDQILFLTLPRSRIEVDIPLIAWFPPTDRPDAGIEPDVLAPATVESFRRGGDPALEAAAARIAAMR